MQFNTSTTVKGPRPKTLPDLGYFSGTEHYYPAMMGYMLTDGVKHVCEAAHAYWLTDVIISHAMHFHGTSLLDCTLLVDDVANSAVFTMKDGNEEVLATQDIPYTDFPALTCRIWVSNGVLMLPSEY